MFEIGMRVVCTKPAEYEWFPGIPADLCPKNVPVTGGIYTIREVVMGSDIPGGPHWTQAACPTGLILEEIRNEPRWTTNQTIEEQAFHDENFMPLDEVETAVERKVEEDA